MTRVVGRLPHLSRRGFLACVGTQDMGRGGGDPICCVGRGADGTERCVQDSIVFCGFFPPVIMMFPDATVLPVKEELGPVPAGEPSAALCRLGLGRVNRSSPL